MNEIPYDGRAQLLCINNATPPNNRLSAATSVIPMIHAGISPIYTTYSALIRPSETSAVQCSGVAMKNEKMTKPK